MSGGYRLAWALVSCAVVACSTHPVELLPKAGTLRDAGPARDAGFAAEAGFGADASVADSGALGEDARIADAGAPARCGNRACACDDGADNDGDGLIDGFDPECTGAWDQDETSFATGHESKAKSCRDCFWDEDQGKGNDACRYPTECLKGDAVSGNGSCGSCKVSETCVETCAARTPSGCDCFGCCDVTRPDGSMKTVELSERCSLATLDDPNACPPCFKSSQCANTCERCELCPGRTLRDLPADCHARTPANSCDRGQPACTTSSDCAVDQYCQLGCCFALLL